MLPDIESGYCPCACRDCPEVAIRSDGETDALCHDCEAVGCEPNNGECARLDGYGYSEEP